MADKIINKRKRKIWIIIGSIALVLAILVGACAIYLGDYYRADMGAIEAFEAADVVEMQTLSNGDILFAPENAKTGLIFYPGGKVEHAAYIPFMQALASEGVLCVITEMPFNLAVFDINAADGIQEDYPDVESWYIGGHSLGGSMAASYLSDRADEYEGLILLGSYSTADLSDMELKVLSVYGSEDTVLNREKYEESKSNLPDDLTEVVIEGGCHAYFGMYGAQEGDGTPTVSCGEQIDQTVGLILELIKY